MYTVQYCCFGLLRHFSCAVSRVFSWLHAFRQFPLLAFACCHNPCPKPSLLSVRVRIGCCIDSDLNLVSLHLEFGANRRGETLFVCFFLSHWNQFLSNGRIVRRPTDRSVNWNYQFSWIVIWFDKSHGEYSTWKRIKKKFVFPFITTPTQYRKNAFYWYWSVNLLSDCRF